jgi:hypothetical protein
MLKCGGREEGKNTPSGEGWLEARDENEHSSLRVAWRLRSVKIYGNKGL